MAQQAQNLVIDSEECVNLTPDSPRFKDVVQQFRPQSIAEVRRLLGPSPGSSAEGCCMPSALTASLPSPDALMSEDPQERTRARMQAVTAARAYVQAADTRDFKHMEPLLNRFIEISKPILHGFQFADIDIANGATLTLTQNVHLLYASAIRMHGTGRMVCKGPTTIRASSVNGRIPTFKAVDVAQVSLANAIRNP